MADAHTDTETEDKSVVIDPETAKLEATLAQAEAEASKPTTPVKVTSKRDRGADIPVTIEQTKRHKLNEILELLRDFTPKEVRAIVKVDKRRRRAHVIENKNQGTITTILGK